MVDALSRRYIVLVTLGAQIHGFDNIHELYLQDPHFSSIYKDCQENSQGGFYVNNGYLFKEERVCIPHSSHRKLLIQEMHAGDLWDTLG